MIKAELEWITPDAENLISKMARVSNPKNKENYETAPRLLRYLIRQKHWSPFEMVNACFYIECPRDISRQLLRHKSLHFQEYSGRYAEYTGELLEREPRMQDTTNRQNSLSDVPLEVSIRFGVLQSVVQRVCIRAYRTALSMGIAKEVARVLLPEGLVPSALYVNGTIRSWIHYLEVRTDSSTQKEHRELAEAIKAVLIKELPVVMEAVNDQTVERT